MGGLYPAIAKAAPLLRSEFKSRAHLDIARSADAPVPQPELIASGCAGHVVVEGLSSPLAGTGEGVPVEQVEELGAKLEVQPLRDSSVLDQRHVLVMVSEPPKGSDARSRALVILEGCVVEVGQRLESADVEQGITIVGVGSPCGATLAGIKAALARRKRILTRDNPRNASLPELARYAAVEG